ncbi:DUF4838 domain-containing protein [bacterium]|nr:DUF4838 domain-containing protein [bacterium]
MTIHIDPGVTGLVAQAAAELARSFEQASAMTFTVTTNAFTGRGVYLTTADRDRYRQAPATLADQGPEGIYQRGTRDQVYIVGNTDLALQEGVYLYLERLGFRWYFAHPAWHIVPPTKKLFAAGEVLTRPDYEYRRIWYAYGTHSKQADADMRQWERANRLGGAFRASTGHAYPGIVNRNKAEFANHPEYFAILADGQRDTNRVAAARKFCVSSEGLVRLCIADAFRQFDRNPDQLMVSLDPSDGPGSCECPDCRQIGSISDRVFHLANRVAVAVGDRYPGKWVGLYAYSSHQLLTKLKLAPNLYVMIATAFNSTPFTIDELIEQWGQRVTKLGIREYYGVMAWDWDMPGKPRGAQLDYLRRSIPHFHAQHANAISAESNIGWISRGLGHYVAAKLLWDIHTDVDAVVADLYERCFGPAQEPIRELFDRWQANPNPVPTSHDLAVWLRLVADAEQLAPDDTVRDRLEQVRYYLHYVALYHEYQTALDETAKRQAYEDVLRYAWRIKDLGVCASYPLARRIAGGKALTPQHHWQAPDCIWRDETPVSREELATLIRADRARYHEVQELKVVDYPPVYVPWKGAAAPPVETPTLRAGHTFIIQVPGPGATLRITGGFIYDRVYELTLRVFGLTQDTDDANDIPLLERKVPGDEQPHDIDLGPLPAGVYRLTVEDRRSAFKLQAGEGVRLSVHASPTAKIWTVGRANFYFHVPRGTRKLVIVSSGPLTVQKPGGAALTWPERQLLREIAVQPGEEGSWEIRQQAGQFYLLGIPALVGFAPQQMLLPEAALR